MTSEAEQVRPPHFQNPRGQHFAPAARATTAAYLSEENEHVWHLLRTAGLLGLVMQLSLFQTTSLVLKVALRDGAQEEEATKVR